MNYKDVLGPGGLVAARLERYETRPEQLEMAEAVQDAVEKQHHLIVEAGTGVGKSFAYLVPAILYATADQDSSQSVSENSAPRRVVVSTHTIALQEQLYEKDIPFLTSIFPFEFSSVLMKGRSNYLCRRRAANAVNRSHSLFSDDEEIQELERIVKWMGETSDGSVSDIDPQPKRDVWDEVSCEQGNCLGRSCRYYRNCFYQAARRRVEQASVIIVNHALLFSDLAVRTAGGSILPEYDLLVFDEAHTMEMTAGSHLGISISQGQIEYLLNRLWNDRTEKGTLADQPRQIFDPDQFTSSYQEAFEEARGWVDESRYRAESLFENLKEWFLSHPNSNGRILEPGIVGHGLEESLVKLSNALHNAIGSVSDQERKTELTAARQRVIAIKGLLSTWINQEDTEMVYWLEKFSSTRRGVSIKICAAPVNVGRLLRENLFSKVKSVVMTSATLASASTVSLDASSNPFSYFQSRIGLTSVPTLLLGSPFNYSENVTLVIPKFLGDIRSGISNEQPFYNALMRYIKETEGGTFVLFTNYSLMKRTAEFLTQKLINLGYPLLTQGEGIPRSRMIEEFKKNNNSVLLGTDSFWQGVNVPGDVLRNVIITQLPFAVPNQPLNEARTEAIDLAGGNSFRDYTLPQAVIKLKQGFGRLIRTAADHGIVVITDTRVITKSYGRTFLRALPDCKLRCDKY